MLYQAINTSLTIICSVGQVLRAITILVTAVGGVVMMLKGANAHQVIDDVETRIQTIQKSLPKGVTIEPYLNRSDLVGRAIGTVSKNLIEGALIVIFILVLLLGNGINLSG